MHVQIISKSILWLEGTLNRKTRHFRGSAAYFAVVALTVAKVQGRAADFSAGIGRRSLYVSG